MPKMPGSSKKAFKFNVSELIKSGRPQRQALAIAFKWQREARGKKGR